jgi:RNA ligase
VDGSLGIFYDDGAAGAIATRGSFTSPQALWATKWFKENIWNWKKIWGPNETPLFEIIYPENRIVVDYGGWGGLVVLGVINKETGRELSRTAIENRFGGNMRIVRDYSGAPLDDLIKIQIPEEEGFVVIFENGLKVKIKMEEYKRLHRIVTGMNPHTVWESLRDGKELPKEGLPVNFKGWLESWQIKLEVEFTDIMASLIGSWINRPIDDAVDARRYRASFAGWVKLQNPKLKSLLFLKLDGKAVNDAVWKLIEPRGDDKSFRTSEEE